MKIVAVSACSAGIAHTYMAAEGLKKSAKKAAAAGGCRPPWPRRRRSSRSAAGPVLTGRGLRRGWPAPSLPSGSPGQQSTSEDSALS